MGRRLMTDTSRRLAALGLMLTAILLMVAPRVTVPWADVLGAVAIAASAGALLAPATIPLDWFVLLGALTTIAALTRPSPVALALTPGASILAVVGLGLISRAPLRLHGSAPEWITLAGALAAGVALEVVPALVQAPRALSDILGAVFTLVLTAWLLVMANRAFGTQSAK
jgi:hypothetical protein